MKKIMKVFAEKSRLNIVGLSVKHFTYRVHKNFDFRCIFGILNSKTHRKLNSNTSQLARRRAARLATQSSSIEKVEPVSTPED